MKFWMWLFPLLRVWKISFAEDAGGGAEDAGGSDDSSGLVENGGSVSRELPADGGRQRSAAPAEKPWYESSGVDPAILTDKDKEYKTLTDYVKGTQSARQLAASKGIPIPAKDATPEQRAAFQAEVFKHFPDLPVAPASADQYEIALFKDSGMAPERQKAITGAFHKAGLSNKHADAVMDIYAEQVALDMAEAQAHLETQRKATDAELKKEWGAEFADRQAGIDRIGSKYPELMEAMKQVGLDARKDFRVMMDEVARSISEDHPAESGGDTLASIDQQITDMRAKVKGTENSIERVKLNDQLSQLYARRASMRKK
jgi:hypothetical protein